jgi:hypothetical protein
LSARQLLYSYLLVLHQRCWVHLLRDRHELEEQHPADADMQRWAKDVKAIYDRAVAYPSPDPSLPRESIERFITRIVQVSIDR